MDHTFPNQVKKEEQQDISTYPIAMMKISTIAPFSPCIPSSNKSCHQPPRQNLLHFTTAASLLPHFKPHKRNMATPNWLPLPSPLTTSLPKASQWEQWLPRPPNQWINALIGSMLTCATPIPVSLAKGYPQLRQPLQQTSCPKTLSNCMPIFVFDNTTFPEQWSHMSP